MQFNVFDTVTWSVKEGVWTITSVRSDNPPTYWIQLGDDVSTESVGAGGRTNVAASAPVAQKIGK